MPFSDAAGTVGFDSVVACARSLVEVQVEAEDIAGSGEPIRLGGRRVRLPEFAGTCAGTVYYAQKVINVVGGCGWALDHGRIVWWCWRVRLPLVSLVSPTSFAG